MSQGKDESVPPDSSLGQKPLGRHWANIFPVRGLADYPVRNLSQMRETRGALDPEEELLLGEGESEVPC